MTTTSTKAKKSPLKDRPLRYPGQSVNEQIQDLVDSIVTPLMLTAALLVVTIFIWTTWLAQKPQNPTLITVVTIISTTYSAYKYITAMRKIQILKMARDGEMAVGQYLELLRANGCQIFHDLRGEGFNLDHVILSSHGFYTVETKTYSKPAKGAAEITLKDGHIYANGMLIERDPVIQARAQARWLQDLLQTSTGKRFPIQPVIVFPGWFVERMKDETEVWVLNPKALPSFIANAASAIPSEDVFLAAYHLSRYSRTK